MNGQLQQLNPESFCYYIQFNRAALLFLWTDPFSFFSRMVLIRLPCSIAPFAPPSSSFSLIASTINRRHPILALPLLFSSFSLLFPFLSFYFALSSLLDPQQDSSYCPSLLFFFLFILFYPPFFCSYYVNTSFFLFLSTHLPLLHLAIERSPCPQQRSLSPSLPLLLLSPSTIPCPLLCEKDNLSIPDLSNPSALFYDHRPSFLPTFLLHLFCPDSTFPPSPLLFTFAPLYSLTTSTTSLYIPIITSPCRNQTFQVGVLFLKEQERLPEFCSDFFKTRGCSSPPRLSTLLHFAQMHCAAWQTVNYSCYFNVSWNSSSLPPFASHSLPPFSLASSSPPYSIQCNSDPVATRLAPFNLPDVPLVRPQDLWHKHDKY